MPILSDAPALLALVAAFPFYALLAAAGWTDARSLRIPNWLTLSLALAFIPAALILWGLAGAAIDWPGHLTTGSIVGGLALVCFLMRGLGGGDVKLLAGVGLWLGPDRLGTFAIAIAATGLILAAAILLARAAARYAPSLPGTASPVLSPGGPLPYGIAIASAGWLAGTGLLTAIPA